MNWRGLLLLLLVFAAILVVLYAIGVRRHEPELAPVDPTPVPAVQPVPFPPGTYPYCMGRTRLPCVSP